MENFIKAGDIVVFDNKHKIYCGDSTQESSYDFMKNEIATLCFTSPPYNVGANNYGSNLCDVQKYNFKAEIKNTSNKYFGENDMKSEQEYLDFLLTSSNNALNKSKYFFLNIAHTSGNKMSLIDYMSKMKEKYVDTIIWVKENTLPVIEPNVLNSDFEYIYIFTNIENNGKHIRIGDDFRGSKSNVLKIKRNMKNKYANIHKALMPIDLCDEIIKGFTKEQDIVLDIFSGLATNMISCMANDRIYRGIELEPYYVEQTINRYLEYKLDDYDVKIIRNGQTINFDDIKGEILNEWNLFTI